MNYVRSYGNYISALKGILFGSLGFLCLILQLIFTWKKISLIPFLIFFSLTVWFLFSIFKLIFSSYRKLVSKNIFNQKTEEIENKTSILISKTILRKGSNGDGRYLFILKDYGKIPVDEETFRKYTLNDEIELERKALKLIGNTIEIRSIVKDCPKTRNYTSFLNGKRLEKFLEKYPEEK